MKTGLIIQRKLLTVKTIRKRQLKVESNIIVYINISDKNEQSEDDKLKEMLANCVVTEKPNVKWDDVAGL